MNKESYAGKSATALFQKKLKILSMNLRERDEVINKKVFYLRALCEEAEKLERDIKYDAFDYHLIFDEYLKLKTDYDRHKKASRAQSYASACKA